MKLNYKVLGQGEPIIILHGLFGTLDNWQTIGRQLAEYCQVILIDQRNHGRSPHVEGLSYPLLAEDLFAFIADNGIYEATIIGHSMGGKTAMQFALDYSNHVTELIVIDIAPKAYIGGHELIIDAMLALQPAQLENRSAADAMLEEKGIADFGVRQFLLKNLARNKPGGYRWKMNLTEIHRNYANILAPIVSEDEFEQATLFIRGANSDYILDSDQPLIQSYFPAAELVTIPAAGHWVHADQPKALLQTILNFLEL